MVLLNENMSLEQAHKRRLAYALLESNGSADEIKYYEGKLFTGFAVTYYYPNGNVDSEEEYVNGERVGWMYEYYENGNLKYKSLRLWQTSYEFEYYDENGNQTKGGLLSTMEDILERLAEYGVDYFYKKI